MAHDQGVSYNDPEVPRSKGRFRIGPCSKQRVWKIIRKNMLLILMIVAMVIGILLGIFIRRNHPEFGKSQRNVVYWSFPGKLILNLLKVCIVPLVVSTLIAGMASLHKQAQGRIGGFTVIYYLTTTFLAVLMGILLVCTIQPGYRYQRHDAKESNKIGNTVDTFLDILRNVFPDNIIKATMISVQTDVKFENVTFNETLSNGTIVTRQERRYKDEVKVLEKSRTNMLGIIAFALAFGTVISRMGKAGQPLRDFFISFSEAMMSLIRAIIWLVPILIVFIVSGRLIQAKNLEEEFVEVGWYIGTVLIGLALHGFIILPLILLLLGRRNPFTFLLDMSRALLTALSTASSAATMPVTLRCLTEKAKVNKLVSSFVIPVGATVNMDGTALYEAVASIFLAQTLDMELTPSKVVIVSITATLAAIGAAGVPEAGLFTMLIVLQAIGIDFENVGLILAVDWFLDRCRTTINVWGDSVGAVVVERLTSKHLTRLEEQIRDDEEPDVLPPSYYKDRNGSPGVFLIEDPDRKEWTHL